MNLLVLFACSAPPEEAVTPTFSLVQGEDLTDDALAAVDRSPAWIRPDLRLALLQQDHDRQDELAATILGVDIAQVDEVAFAMAHLSPEVLGSKKFYPELLVENAEGIYAVDPELDYVELVDVGTPGDDDWYTTTRYQVETDGVVSAVDLDPEIYYWYIVHPRIEDEHPWYIDAWAECNSQDLECAEDPETGTFWRSFLWSDATDSCPDGYSCPVVKDYLPGATVLWGAADSDDAVHRIAGMMLDSPNEARWFNFGAYGERSIQPNRIYALGRGNCGEWADMTTALSRTALIPNLNVTPSSWDHTWSAFYLDRWVAWEPVNWWFDYGYASGYATYATRGDTSMFYQTEQYTTTTATFEVQVKDSEGEPVDGATVALWSPYDTSYWYAGEQVTDLDGVARFTVGADLEFAWMVTSELGGGEALDGTITGIAEGETEQETTRLDGTKTLFEQPGTDAGPGIMKVDVNVTAEGRLQGLSYRFGETSSQVTTAPTLSTWLLTWEQYHAFADGEPFTANDSVYPGVGGVVVVANTNSMGVAAVGDVAITAHNGDVTSEYTRSFALMPGQWTAVGVAGE